MNSIKEKQHEFRDRSNYEKELLKCLETKEWNEFIRIIEQSKVYPHLLNDASSDFVTEVGCKIWHQEEDTPTAVSDAFVSSCVATSEEDKITLLSDACMVGASDHVIEPLLNVDPAFSCRLCSDGASPLRFAVSRTHPNLNTVDKLVQKNPGLVKIADEAGCLPIHYAAHCLDDYTRAGMIAFLLDAHPDGALVSRNWASADPLTTAWDHFCRKAREAQHPNFFMRRITDSVRSNSMDEDIQYRLLCCLFLLLAATKKSWPCRAISPVLSLVFSHRAVGPDGDVKWTPVDAAAKLGSRCPLELLHFLLAIYFENPRKRDKEGRLSLHVIAAAPPRSDELESSYRYRYMYNDDGEDGTCASSFLQWALRSFPGAAKVADNHGRLPLHVHAGATDPVRDDIPPTYDLHLLLTAFPMGAKKRDKDGRLPLHHAIARGRAWSKGTLLLFQAYPEAIEIRDPETGLYAFMLAGASDECRLDTVYCLLRADPTLVRSGIKDRKGDLKRTISTLENKAFQTNRKIRRASS